MRNFQLLHQGLDIVPAMNQLIRSGNWNQNTLRTTHEDSPHQQVDDIWLRFNEVDDESKVVNDDESINYPSMWLLTEARKMVFWLFGRVEGERLGRCLITRLCPGEKIALHADMGSPAEYYERYHIVLQGLAGSVFKCGDESVQMRTGEVWWFDNIQEHEVINNSADDRIHLIVDIRTPQ